MIASAFDLMASASATTAALVCSFAALLFVKVQWLTTAAGVGSAVGAGVGIGLAFVIFFVAIIGPWLRG
jgi:hypothetical protein